MFPVKFYVKWIQTSHVKFSWKTVIKPQIPPGSILTIQKKKNKKKIFPLKMAHFVEKIDLEIFFEKKKFFWDLVVFSESTWVKKKWKIFFLFLDSKWLNSSRKPVFKKIWDFLSKNTKLWRPISQQICIQIFFGHLHCS